MQTFSSSSIGSPTNFLRIAYASMMMLAVDQVNDFPEAVVVPLASAVFGIHLIIVENVQAQRFILRRFGDPESRHSSCLWLENGQYQICYKRPV